MPKILLVEDEPSLRMLIHDNLEQEGYEVQTVADGLAGLEAWSEQRPDLIILDVMLPGRDGFAVAKSLRKQDTSTPILFLTAKSRPKDVVQGFEAGGNDYLKKPFGLEELLVLVKVLMSDHRLLPSKTDEKIIIQLGRTVFDTRRRQLVFGEGEIVQLTIREADLLQILVHRRGEVVPKTYLLERIWGDDGFLNSRSLDVFISRLRKYLKPAGDLEIVNQRGVGYMLVVHDE